MARSCFRTACSISGRVERRDWTLAASAFCNLLKCLDVLVVRGLLLTQRMSRYPRHIVPGALYELTIRTVQGRRLLRPSPKLNDRILGILGRAQALRPGVDLVGFIYMSTHSHLYVIPESGRALADFMEYVDGQIAKITNRINGWSGHVWSRRYVDVRILDDEASIQRLRYALSHGVKENLVGHPAAWPGVHCVDALRYGTILRGHWHDRTREGEDERSKTRKRGPAGDYLIPYTVKLVPLPAWAHLSDEARRRRFCDMVDDIVAETRARHEVSGTRPLGPNKVLAEDPTSAPEQLDRSPAPICHTTYRELRQEWVEARRVFVETYHAAVDRLRLRLPDCKFPLEGIPPVRPPALTGAGPP